MLTSIDCASIINDKYIIFMYIHKSLFLYLIID